jgi:hypothetical protein
MGLGKTGLLANLGLAPATAKAGGLQLPADGLREAVHSDRLPMRFHLFDLSVDNSAYHISGINMRFYLNFREIAKFTYTHWPAGQ